MSILATDLTCDLLSLRRTRLGLWHKGELMLLKPLIMTMRKLTMRKMTTTRKLITKMTTTGKLITTSTITTMLSWARVWLELPQAQLC